MFFDVQLGLLLNSIKMILDVLHPKLRHNSGPGRLACLYL